MTEQIPIPAEDTKPNPWSEEAFNAERDKSRPTADQPHMFDIEDAVKSISFQQVEGETLRGIVAGYFYNEAGEKVNLVALNRQSAEKAGWNNEAQGYMKVPDAELRRPEQTPATPEASEAMPQLTEAQEDVAEEAIEDTLGIENPSEVDENAHSYTPDELKGMREASRRIVDQDGPTIPNLAEMMSGEAAPTTPTIPNLKEMMSGEEQPAATKSPEQAEYDNVKADMAKLVEGLSDTDKLYLDQYVQAGPTRYNEQAVATAKMSSDLLQQSDLIKKYQALHDKRYGRTN